MPKQADTHRMAFVRRALKRASHPLMVLFVAAGLLVPIQLATTAPAQAAAGPIQIAIGQSHACALNQGGVAQCWGSNDSGRLGHGSAASSSATPVSVTQSSIAYIAISAGASHTCALSAAGQAYCWGVGGSGQIGNGSSNSPAVPTAVTQGGVTYSSIASGNAFSCGLTSNGQAYCWGYNTYGQLGNASTTSSNTPVAVTQGAVTFSSITTGGNHMCGLTSGGQAYCWGYGPFGQLGNGGTGNKTTPFAVTQGAVTFTSIVAGSSHTCGLTSGGQAYCWGYNANGQIGNSSTSNQSTPTAVSQGGLTFASITAGTNHTCGLTSGGQTYCWGSNVYGQLGDGTTSDRTTPVAVSQNSALYLKVASGSSANVTCAVDSSTSQLRCWGERAGSPIGDGVYAGQATKPTAVIQSPQTFTQIRTGQYHTCALDNSGQTYCWGYNNVGQLGTGVFSTRATTPAAVSQAGNTYASIAVGANHTRGLTSAGQAYCWGSNGSGQLGNGGTTTQAAPVAVSQAGVTFSSIVAGALDTCALTSAGQAYCWGIGTQGQLGDGSNTTTQSTPVAVSQGGVTFSSLAEGGSHTCGLTSAGQTYCWGAGGNGRLGNGASSDATTPVAVTQGGFTYVSISAGSSHTCGLTSSGQAYCWGTNTNGQIGNGGTTNQTTPAATTQGGVTFAAITTGLSHTCALTSAGQSYCWGLNTFGQVGDGTVTQRTSPVAVQPTSLNFSAIAAGQYADHSCALTNGGQAYCWGWDLYGQLGVNHNVLTPVLALYVVDSEGAAASATIDPSFTFSLAGRATACNGSSTPTGTATSTSIDLGHLTSATPVLGAQDFTAATNAGGGFSVAVKFSGPLTSTTGTAFANASGSAGTPAAFGAGEHFGYTTSANAGFSGPLWAGPTTAYATLYTNPGATASVSNCIAYQAAAGPLTPAGAYSVTVIYLAVPTF